MRTLRRRRAANNPLRINAKDSLWGFAPVIAVVTLFLFGCGGQQAGRSAVPVLQSDELDVYAASIGDEAERAGKIVFVHAATEPFHEADGQLAIYEPGWRQRGFLAIKRSPAAPDKDALPLELPVSMLDEFRALNLSSARMPSVWPFSHIVVQLTEADNIADGNTQGYVPDPRYGQSGRPIARYGRDQLVALNVRTFSRVAFNPNHTIAMFAVSDKCDRALCGGGELLVYARDNGAWTLAGSLSNWVY